MLDLSGVFSALKKSKKHILVKTYSRGEKNKKKNKK